MKNILFDVQDGVATIKLNRAEKYNSFIREMALDLQACLDKCAEDDSIRAVLLTGVGKAFCAGQDLQEAVEAEESGGLQYIISEHYNPIIKKITDLEKPIVAAVNGVAAGAGANIAIACDIVLATESASFIQAFSKIGLIPDSGGTYFLPRLIGYQRALALMMTGDKVSAADAQAMGMIFKVYANDDFQEESTKFINKLAKMPTYALSLTKKALQQSMVNDLSQQCDLEEKYQHQASLSEDYKEGTTAFLEKRKAIFKGK